MPEFIGKPSNLDLICQVFKANNCLQRLLNIAPAASTRRIWRTANVKPMPKRKNALLNKIKHYRAVATDLTSDPKISSPALTRFTQNLDAVNESIA